LGRRSVGSSRGSEPDWADLLTEQVRQNGRLFFKVAFGILRDAAGAEEVCQQAYLRAWDQRDRIKDGSALRPWLIRVVSNECFGILRRRRVEQEDLIRRTDRPVIEDNPGSRMARREVVANALGELSEPTRMVVTLRLMQGLSGNEVKEHLGCSASEVSRRLHEGMQTLRTLLAEEFD